MRPRHDPTTGGSRTLTVSARTSPAWSRYPLWLRVGILSAEAILLAEVAAQTLRLLA